MNGYNISFSHTEMKEQPIKKPTQKEVIRARLKSYSAAVSKNVKPIKKGAAATVKTFTGKNKSGYFSNKPRLY